MTSSSAPGVRTMPPASRRGLYRRSFLVIFVAVLTMVLAVTLVMVEDRRHHWSEMSEADSGRQIRLASEFIKEALLRNDYHGVEGFLRRWFDDSERLVDMEATAPNGFVIAHLARRGGRQVPHLARTEALEFEGRKLLTLKIAYDVTASRKEIIHLVAQIALFGVGLCLALMAMIWVLIRRTLIIPLEGYERTIQENRERLNTILEAVGDGIYVLDREGRAIFVNPAAARMLGWEARELVGRHQHPIHHHTRPDGTPYPWEECPTYASLREGTVRRVADEVFWRKDGSSFPVDYISTPAVENGVINGAVVVFRDVTQQRAAETATQDSLHRFFAVVESLDALVWVADLEHHEILFANQTMREHYGNVVGQPCWRVFHPEETGPCGFCDNSKLIAADGTPSAPRLWEDERPRDGRWYEYRARTIPWSDGRVVRLQITTDITDRKRMEIELAKKTEALAESNRELQNFVHIVSHDLQEPLRTVSSFVKLLAQRYRGRLDADADEFIGFVVEGAERMSAMIRDLVDFSRVGSQRKDLMPVDMDEIVRAALDNLKAAINEASAQVTAVDNLPIVFGDRSQLVRLFQNLIGNAIKYRAPDRTPVVSVNCGPGEGEWVFSVRDNGIGIASRYFEKIFVIFQRLHGRGEYEGTGIGLAVCKRIVERHGGRIWVESEPGRGSSFFLTLPSPHARGDCDTPHTHIEPWSSVTMSTPPWHDPVTEREVPA